MIDKKIVGKRIKKIRLEMGYTMEEFGEICSTGKAAVFNWETGRNLPNKKRLLDIAFQGQISVDELLHGKQEQVIDPAVLFNNKNDIRKYLTIDIDYDHREVVADDGIDYETIERVLELADIYVNMGELPEEISIDLQREVPKVMITNDGN